uniref:RING-type E3 ubiquitin transferase n=1 Tax=Pelusios castaneus TaxID=367368 RepID=A0A8C8SLH9_9SAUR
MLINEALIRLAGQCQGHGTGHRVHPPSLPPSIVSESSSSPIPCPIVTQLHLYPADGWGQPLPASPGTWKWLHGLLREKLLEGNANVSLALLLVYQNLPVQHHPPPQTHTFQWPGRGELLSPCRCDGSVRCTHQPCLIRWISERGSWSCELCYFKYQVLAISTKNPLQWQAISLTVIEKVQIAAIILGSLFLIASISWLVWSSLSPSAKWQRQDLLFQICYGMYGFMDIVCIGLIIHEGSSVYRIFKRWQAVNQQWKVLNYDKAKDLGEPVGGATKAGGRNSRTNPSSGSDRNPRRGQRVRTILNHHCGYTILHILSHLRPNEPRSGASSGREVVMRVTTV